jgi:hypothetical protein
MAESDDLKSEIREQTDQGKWPNNSTAPNGGRFWIRARRDLNLLDSFGPTSGANFLERLSELCTKIKVAGAEVASTTIFIVALYRVARYEITHLLAR